MANRIKFELSGFEELITKLDELQTDIRPILTEALEDAGEDVGTETYEAMDKANLPAKGKFSTGQTVKTILKAPKVEWSGFVAEIGLGFDNLKDGVGLMLITGTPRMSPNRELERLFARKKYASDLSKQISETLTEAVIEKME